MISARADNMLAYNIPLRVNLTMSYLERTEARIMEIAGGLHVCPHLALFEQFYSFLISYNFRFVHIGWLDFLPRHFFNHGFGSFLNGKVTFCSIALYIFKKF